MFRDRADAGRHLAARLTAYADRGDVVALGLARGGVAVAAEVAAALRVPLDVVVVRKLGLPGHPELAMGAVGPGGTTVRNEEVLSRIDVPAGQFQQVLAHERAELQRREETYRAGRSAVAVSGRTALLIDDGLATGASMKATVLALRHQHPARVVVAVPVGPATTCAELAEVADEVVCAETPSDFTAVGAYYEDFSQTTDDDVAELLR